MNRAAFAIVACLGCKGPEPKPGPGIEVYSDDVVVESQQLRVAHLRFPWEVKNAGPAEAHLGAITWKLSVDGAAGAEGRVVPDAAVAAGQSATGAIAVDVPLATDDATLQSNATRQSIPVHLEAQVQVDGQSFDADWQGELFPPRRPTVTANAQAARYQGNLELHLMLHVHNPNAFAIPVEKLGYVWRIEGTEIQRADLTHGKDLPAGADLDFDVTRVLGRGDFQELADKLLKQRRVAWEVDTELHAAGLVLPAPLRDAIEFPR